MKHRPLAYLLLAPLVAACSDAGGPTPGDERPNNASLSLGLPRASARPDDAVRGFLDAVASEDVAARQSFLTLAAREGYENGSFEFKGSDLQSYRLGNVEVSGETARVEVAIERDDRTDEFTLLLRLEDQEWRIRGAAVPMGESEFTIDFEGLEAELAGFGEELAQGLAEGLAEGLQQAFDDSMAEWQAGGSAEEIAAARAAFDALEATDEAAFDASWRVDLVGTATGREHLQHIVEGSGLRFDVDEECGARLEKTQTFDQHAISRIEALERVAQAAGCVPVLPVSEYGMASDVPLTFRVGQRDLPLTFSGPFSIEVASLEETAPHARGKVTLRIAALGLPGAVLATNRDMDEFLRVADVHSRGTNLWSDEGMQFMGSPTVENGLLTYDLDLELLGLLRGVETIDRLTGDVLLRLPVEVHAARLDPLTPGEHRIGPWTVSCSDVDAQTTFQLRHAGSPGNDVEVRADFRPDAASGEALGIQWSSTSGYGEQFQADLQVSEAPAALGMKVSAMRQVSFPFELPALNLREFAKQPAQLEALRFSGEAPLALQHVGPGAHSTPDFQEIRIAVRNGANKDALDAQATFQYLDARGQVLEEFPHNVTGVFTFEGPQPLAEAGSATEIDSTAFFMPEGTQSIRIRLDEVSFIDGTRWSREP